MIPRWPALGQPIFEPFFSCCQICENPRVTIFFSTRDVWGVFSDSVGTLADNLSKGFRCYQVNHYFPHFFRHGILSTCLYLHFDSTVSGVVDLTISATVSTMMIELILFLDSIHQCAECLSNTKAMAAWTNPMSATIRW